MELKILAFYLNLKKWETLRYDMYILIIMVTTKLPNTNPIHYQVKSKTNLTK